MDKQVLKDICIGIWQDEELTNLVIAQAAAGITSGKNGRRNDFRRWHDYQCQVVDADTANNY